jgi:hypothetical protein
MWLLAEDTVELCGAYEKLASIQRADSTPVIVTKLSSSLFSAPAWLQHPTRMTDKMACLVGSF